MLIPFGVASMPTAKVLHNNVGIEIESSVMHYTIVLLSNSMERQSES